MYTLHTSSTKQVYSMLCLTADHESALSIYVRQPDSPSSVSHIVAAQTEACKQLTRSQVDLGV